MKKRAKKLVLAKETVKDLDLELWTAVGGMTVWCGVGNTESCYYCPREKPTV